LEDFSYKEGDERLAVGENDLFKPENLDPARLSFSPTTLHRLDNLIKFYD
jgi:hypothetical protein